MADSDLAPEPLRPLGVEAMFRAHYRHLVGSVALVVGDRQLAEEAVQEAFARALVRWERIRRYDDPVMWVRRVAINVARDHHRKRNRTKLLLRRLARSGEPEPAPDASLSDLSALEELSFGQRCAAVLFYVEDLPVREVAAVMGVSEGTVKTHLSRARNALREKLEVPDES